MRLPKYIRILGDTYRVLRVKNKPYGGEFDCNKHTIKMNSEHKKNYSDILFHEVSEIVSQQLRFRWNITRPILIGKKPLQGTTIILSHDPHGVDDFSTYCLVLHQVIIDNKLFRR